MPNQDPEKKPQPSEEDLKNLTEEELAVMEEILKTQAAGAEVSKEQPTGETGSVDLTEEEEKVMSRSAEQEIEGVLAKPETETREKNEPISEEPAPEGPTPTAEKTPEELELGAREAREKVKKEKEEVEKEKEELERLAKASEGVERLTEEAELTRREAAKEIKIEDELNARREDYVNGLLAKEKAAQLVGKLSGWRRFFKSEEKLKGKAAAEEELQKLTRDLEGKQGALKEGLKNYREFLLDKKRQELAGLTREEQEKEIEKYAKKVAIDTSAKEATNIYLLKHEKEIEEKARLGEGQKWEWIKTKGLEAAQWYWKLPLKYKLAFTGALVGGGVVAGAVGGATGAALLTGLAFGKATQRAFGGAATFVGLEAWGQRAQEKAAEKKITKEFTDGFLKTLQEKNDALDDKLFKILGGKKSEERRRYLLAGAAGIAVGSGAAAQAFNNLIPAEWKTAIAEKFGFKAAVEKPAGPAPGQPSLPKVHSPDYGYPPMTPETAPSVKPQELISRLTIGPRGSEGTIIDQFRERPEIAKAFGWDGKGSIDAWAGTKAHSLWLEHAKDQLAKPETLEKLKGLGYSQDLEGYGQMMRRIGGGLVEIDQSTGKIRLIDAQYLKARISPGAFVSEARPDVETMEPPRPYGAGMEEVEPPALLETIRPDSQEFYDRQLLMETTEITPEERLTSINESLGSVEKKMEGMLEELEKPDITPEQRVALTNQMYEYQDAKKLLQKAVEQKSYEEPMLVKDVLPPKIMELGHFKTMMLAERFSDWTSEEKGMVDKLFYKYFGHSFENFKSLPPNLRDAYLVNLGREAGQIIKTDAELPEVDLPRKAFLWRNIGEMKWMQQIWEKFGKK